MQSIPFVLSDEGLREISGEVYLDGEFLVFEVVDALFGEFDKDRRVIKIEPKALEEIRLDRGLVRDRLCVRPRAPDLLEAMPGEHVREVRLKVWVTKRRAAEALVREVKQRSRVDRA